ncbi:MAG: glycosyltransferase family 9 protein [Deltaproteobacteria bacterium]|nr:glycosyltransferase family 9 protein [Deltaproteobacteria bacterium]
MQGSREAILILMIAGIGDLVMASRALRAMRNGFPDAKIHLITSSDAAPLARNYPYLDRVWAFPIRELRRNSWSFFRIFPLLRQIRKTRFDLAVNLYRVISLRGALKMGLLIRSVKAGETLGLDAKGFGLFLSRKVPAQGRHSKHFVDAMTDMAVHAGGIPDGGGIEVFWDPKCEKRLSHVFPGSPGLRRKAVGINPGADNPRKRWDPDRYALVAEHLMRKADVQVLLLGGPDELGIAGRIQDRLKGRAVNLSGRLNLDELAYLVGRLDLLITNDSAPMHIAAALKTPVVGIFGPEDPFHTRPYTTDDLYRVISHRVGCRPCSARRCEKPLCLDLIQPEEVIRNCLELMTGSQAP